MSQANGGTAIVQRATVMGALSEKYSMDPVKLLETIKQTCIKGNASPEQVQAFLIVANRYGLDPFLKQIHAFAGQGGGIVPIVGIDGWSKIANDTGLLDGSEFKFDGSIERGDLSCTCTIHVKGRAHPTSVTEYLVECKRNSPPWNTMPRRMLRHKSYMQCVRVAFGLGGIFDEDEARDVMRNAEGAADPAALKALNDAFSAPVPQPHPTDEKQTIDPADASEQPAPEPEFVGEEVPKPTKFSVWPDFENAMRDLVASDSAVTPATVKRALEILKLKNAGKSQWAKIYDAAKAGAFDWNSAEVVG